MIFLFPFEKNTIWAGLQNEKSSWSGLKKRVPIVTNLNELSIKHIYQIRFVEIILIYPLRFFKNHKNISKDAQT